MSKLIEYRGYKILVSVGFYWFFGHPFKTLKKAKMGVDGYIINNK